MTLCRHMPTFITHLLYAMELLLISTLLYFPFHELLLRFSVLSFVYILSFINCVLGS
jgi:hypothetical protein